jgi:hypothetical protein
MRDEKGRFISRREQIERSKKFKGYNYTFTYLPPVNSSVPMSISDSETAYEFTEFGKWFFSIGLSIAIGIILGILLIIIL